MRTLLTFAGSIIYLVVMTVISPLLLAVHAGLKSVMLIRSGQPHIAAWLLRLFSFRTPLVHFSFKKQFVSIWAKAARFHL